MEVVVDPEEMLWDVLSTVVDEWLLVDMTSYALEYLAAMEVIVGSKEMLWGVLASVIAK
jgi:hypothetical protein